MKKTCQTISILLLMCMSCFATPTQESPKSNEVIVSGGVVLLQNLPSTNAYALLSCIGGGMALGGLISVRWAHRRNK
ncbi:MAG TPA: hypothetical protein VLN58_11735 [Verrucomicrobiae bacterium]|nr:hypothetical protein [Verrucomicrobiae bacterium]